MDALLPLLVVVLAMLIAGVVLSASPTSDVTEAAVQRLLSHRSGQRGFVESREVIRLACTPGQTAAAVAAYRAFSGAGQRASQAVIMRLSQAIRI